MAAMLAALLAGTTAPVEVLRWPTAEATQGAVADRHHVYAIGNNMIGKYDKRTGRRVAAWTGSRTLFPHINSCAVTGTRLVCAASNYPAVPQTREATEDNKWPIVWKKSETGRAHASPAK